MSEKIVTFNDVAAKYFQELDLFTTAITRVHGKSHPEAYEVRSLFETIHSKVKKADTSKPNLDEEFTQLRHVTNNYTVPGDVCETYAGVYTMLSEIDKAYLEGRDIL